MNRQAIEDAMAQRLEAKSLRRDAQKESDPKARVALLEDAEAALQAAISTLRRELRAGERQALTRSERAELRELLSSTMGSLGGTYRDAKDYVRAIKAYDDGNDIEQERRTEDGHLDSYNLVQRLVVRLLQKPELRKDMPFKAELEKVERELDRQRSLGRRDSWFLADVILVKFLLDEPADKVLTELESKDADASFYESTDQVIGALLDEGLGKGGELESALQRLRQLLQRRGGLKVSS